MGYKFMELINGMLLSLVWLLELTDDRRLVRMSREKFCLKGWEFRCELFDLIIFE